MGTAIVIGGSMAGMLAARILSERFEKVIVLERDAYPLQARARDGVPQARHLHALLPGGHRVIEELFPGITREWLAEGAEMLDLANDFAWRTPGGWGIRFASDLRMLAASRPLMDHVVRRRLLALPNVRLREGTVADGLLAVEGRVTGVAARRADERHAEPITAELVVDASGRVSRAPQWLQAAGYEPPAESVVNAHLGYASRLYRRDPRDARAWRAMFVQAEPPERPRAGIAFPVEADRWMVTLCGGGKDYAPTDETSFAEFARSLPCSEVHELIVSSQPLGPIAAYRRTENRWRHYERLPRFPRGFLVFGDAAAAFNPVYGQGISVAAGSAMALRNCLAAADRTRLARRFHKRQADVVRTAWTLATGEDAYYRHVEGAGLGAAERFMHWFVLQVMRASTHDAAARHSLLRVFGMVAAPTLLFGPAMLWKVVKQAFFGASHSKHEKHESGRDMQRGAVTGRIRRFLIDDDAPFARPD